MLQVSGKLWREHMHLIRICIDYARYKVGTFKTAGARVYLCMLRDTTAVAVQRTAFQRRHSLTDVEFGLSFA
jgi:hypothetical protein